MALRGLRESIYILLIPPYSLLVSSAVAVAGDLAPQKYSYSQMKCCCENRAEDDIERQREIAKMKCMMTRVGGGGDDDDDEYKICWKILP